jgi:hypothetical protein
MILSSLFRTRRREEEEARSFLHRLLNERCFGDKVAVQDKRLESRSDLVQGVWIVPLVDGAPALDRIQSALTKDISGAGLCVAVGFPLRCQDALVVFPYRMENVFLRCEVLHTTPIGAGFSGVGMRVVERVPNTELLDLDSLDFH